MTRRFFAAMFCAFAVVAAPALAQDPVPFFFDNGNFETSPGISSRGPTADNIVLGVNINEGRIAAASQYPGGVPPPGAPAIGEPSPRRVADDFTLNTGSATSVLELDRLRFYAYTLDSGTTATPIDQVFVAIFQGNPVANAPMIYGDFVTNRLITAADDPTLAPEFTGVYRVTEEDTTSVRRPIFEYNVDLSDAQGLFSGNYFVAISARTNNNSTPFIVPVAPAPGDANNDGNRDGNGVAHIPEFGPSDGFGNFWYTFDINGNLAGSGGLEIPFELFGNIVAAPEPGTMALLFLGGVPVAGIVIRRRIALRRCNRNEDEGNA